jgi:hypothetical protein
MPTILASSVIDRSAILLTDPTNIRWPRTELLTWLNDGQQEIALYKPNAFTKNQTVQLVAGTKQTLPADAVSLITVIRNMGTNGQTPGRGITLVSREIMDSQVSDWHSANPSAEVKHYVYNEFDPKTFYVWPPQPASGQGQVEAVYVASPAQATANSTITIDDIYVTALVNYIMYRAYSKDAEFSANPNMATGYYTAFQSILTGKFSAEKISSPEAISTQFNQNIVASRTPQG